MRGRDTQARRTRTDAHLLGARPASRAFPHSPAGSFARWASLVGSGTRDLGEASVFAYAETPDAVSITDDRAATKVARTRNLEVHGTLWLISGFCGAGKLTEHAASRLIDALRAVDARMPCTGNEFPGWARAQRLLPQARRAADPVRGAKPGPTAR